MLIQGSEKHLLRKLSKTIPMVEPHYWQKYSFTSAFLGSFQSFPVQSFCTTLVNGWLLPFRFAKVWKINFLMINVSEIPELSFFLSLPFTYCQYLTVISEAKRILLQYHLPAPASYVKFLFLLLPIFNKPSIVLWKK